MFHLNIYDKKSASLVVGFFLLVLAFQMFIVASYQQQCQHKPGRQTWDHSIINLSFTNSNTPNPADFGHNEVDNCPSYNHLITYHELSAQNLSLCPWTTEISHEPDRFPHNMTYARCSCKNCATWDAFGNRLQCRAHYHSFKVIRRQCDGGGHYNYFYTHEFLPIACVCSHEETNMVGSTG